MRLIFIIISFSLITTAKAQSFYQLSFKTITGDSVSLSAYAGKKVMFYIVPLQASDSNYAQLQAFKNRYLDTVKIVGVVSFERGYQSSQAAALQSLYSGMGIVLTEGMHTPKASGSNQSPLMSWLTHKTGNTHFDMDETGIGHKFFVTELGRQFAVMPPRVSLQAPIIDKIVHSN